MRKSHSTRDLQLEYFYFDYWYKHSEKPIGKIAEQFGISQTKLKSIIEKGLQGKWWIPSECSIFVTKHPQ